MFDDEDTDDIEDETAATLNDFESKLSTLYYHSTDNIETGAFQGRTHLMRR